MAASPSHRLGQLIGDFLEEIILPLLEDFCQRQGQNRLGEGLFLDKKGEREARSGKKLTWQDKYGNAHDLDFVIERGGTANKIGHPVAFIEAAWRRYTKHSKNKAQEIQGALIPIVENYPWNPPFMGAFLAGVFTDTAIEQMKSAGFTVSLFPYKTIVQAFLIVGVNIEFDEQTSDKHFADIVKRIGSLSDCEKVRVKNHLLTLNACQLKKFFNTLDMALNKGIERLILIPLHGHTYKFKTPHELADFVDKYKDENSDLPLVKYEIFVHYTNGSEIRSQFKEKEEIFKFLEYIAKSVSDLY